jgi:hypothetical protein
VKSTKPSWHTVTADIELLSLDKLHGIQLRMAGMWCKMTKDFKAEK